MADKRITELNQVADIVDTDLMLLETDEGACAIL